MINEHIGFYKGHRLFIVKPIEQKKVIKMTFWERVKTLCLFKSTKEVVTYHDTLEDNQIIFNNGCFYVNERTARHIKNMIDVGEVK